MGAKRLSIDENAVFFDVYLNCHANSNRLKQSLFSILNLAKLTDSYRPVLKKILVNLATVPEGSSLALPLNHDFYNSLESKNAGLTYYKVSKVLDALVAFKFVDVEKGSEQTGYTRVYPRHKLNLHLKTLSDVIYLEKKDAGQLVLRDKWKNDIYIERSETALALISDLNLINEHLRNFKFQALEKRFFPQLVRVFNEDFEHGGRFYCHSYQSLSRKKGQRQTIQIDGVSTVELDYKAIHPTILYSMVNSPYPSDPYSVPAFPRDDAKRAFNILINAQTAEEAMGAIVYGNKMTKTYSEEEAIELMEAVVDLNKPIAEFLGSGAGIRLQYLDSKLCEAILLESVRTSRPILPIHDSFICKAEDEKWLEEMMLSKGREILNVILKVEKKD